MGKDDKEKSKPKYPCAGDGIVRGYVNTLTPEQTMEAAKWIAKTFFNDDLTDAITNAPTQQLKIYGNKKFNAPGIAP